VRRFREAAAVSDQDAATVEWRRIGAARIQNTPRTGQLKPGTTENNNKDNSNSKTLPRERRPRARKGFPQSSALRCAPFVQTRGFPLSLRSVASPGGFPPLALATPAGVGQGQGVVVCNYTAQFKSNNKGERSMTNITATYSPEDNKIRLFCITRLDSETYNRVIKAASSGAPKQELFVTPMWTPPAKTYVLS